MVPLYIHEGAIRIKNWFPNYFSISFIKEGGMSIPG